MPYRLVAAYKEKQQLMESASMDFKMGAGRLKRIYGDDEIPSKDQLEKDATLAAKIYKISDVAGFVKYVETQIKVKGQHGLKEATELHEADWGDCHIAAIDACVSLQKRDWVAFMNGSNAVKIVHDNGAVGSIVFDPVNFVKIKITPKFQKWISNDMGVTTTDAKETIYHNKAGVVVFSVDNKTNALTIHQSKLTPGDLKVYGAELY